MHGFAAGSAIDVFARPLAQKLSEALGQQVVVDSRPGATGTIANELVAKSAPDGYTLLAAPGSAMAATPHLYKVPYDPLRDFAPVIQISAFSYVLVAHPAVPAKTARDLIALAKSRPAPLTYGSTGVGSGFHLAGELFAAMAGIQLLHVPYRGGGSAAITDLVAGRVDLMWDSLAVVLPQMRAGKLRAIGVTGAHRAAALPDVPAIAESGLPGYEMVGWHGVFAPAGTAREIIERLNATIAKILGASDIKELWTTQAMEILPSTPEQFAARLRFDYERYGKLIKSSGISIQR
ncbi:MAG TPA: tripartite tricarboxylate transporter substrate binding protein [Burkholderiales bacterium]|nr:tripartite tricarboxylate transporter substrate binding protein [Burkholderiales bacterium]